MLRSRKPAVVCDDQYRQWEYSARARCSAAKRDLISTTSKRAFGATSSVRSSGLAAFMQACNSLTRRQADSLPAVAADVVAIRHRSPYRRRGRDLLDAASDVASVRRLAVGFARALMARI